MTTKLPYKLLFAALLISVTTFADDQLITKKSLKYRTKEVLLNKTFGFKKIYTDLSLGDDFTFKRGYLADSEYESVISRGWNCSFQSKITKMEDGSLLLIRPLSDCNCGSCNRFELFKKQENGEFHSYTSEISENENGYLLTNRDKSTETYNKSGNITFFKKHLKFRNYQYKDDKLHKVSNERGNEFTFGYTEEGKLDFVESSAGERIDYTYNIDGNLKSVYKDKLEIGNFYYDDNRIQTIYDLSCIDEEMYQNLQDISLNETDELLDCEDGELLTEDLLSDEMFEDSELLDIESEPFDELPLDEPVITSEAEQADIDAGLIVPVSDTEQTELDADLVDSTSEEEVDESEECQFKVGDTLRVDADFLFQGGCYQELGGNLLIGLKMEKAGTFGIYNEEFIDEETNEPIKVDEVQAFIDEDKGSLYVVYEGRRFDLDFTQGVPHVTAEDSTGKLHEFSLLSNEVTPLPGGFYQNDKLRIGSMPISVSYHNETDLLLTKVTKESSDKFSYHDLGKNVFMRLSYLKDDEKAETEIVTIKQTSHESYIYKKVTVSTENETNTTVYSPSAFLKKVSWGDSVNTFKYGEKSQLSLKTTPTAKFIVKYDKAHPHKIATVERKGEMPGMLSYKYNKLGLVEEMYNGITDNKIILKYDKLNRIKRVESSEGTLVNRYKGKSPKANFMKVVGVGEMEVKYDQFGNVDEVLTKEGDALKISTGTAAISNRLSEIDEYFDIDLSYSH